MKKSALLILAVVFILSASACGSESAKYTITLSGVLSEPGVISYAGYEMNVYQDAASISCGDCPDQPVSVCVGATAEEVAQAISQSVERADDIWTVESVSGNVVVLKGDKDDARNLPSPSAPPGLIIEGAFS